MLHTWHDMHTKLTANDWSRWDLECLQHVVREWNVHSKDQPSTGTFLLLDLASPMRCSTSALRSFRIPMQSTLHSHPQQLPVTLNTHIHIHMCTCETCKCTCIHHFNSHFLGKSALAWFCISKYSSNDQRLRCHSSQHCSCTPQIRTLY